MKTLTKILLAIACVCMLFACSKSDDNQSIAPKQLKSAGTYSDTYKTEIGWSTDVYCDGVWVDFIEGSGYGQVIDHYVNGVWQWEILSVKGTGTNLKGETFTFSEQDKIFAKTLPYVWTAHTNIKGGKGTLYNISFILTYDENWHRISTEIKNATCTGNTKN